MKIKEFLREKDGAYILEKILNKNKTWLFLNDNLEVPDEAIEILKRVKSGYPIEYIFEEVWFFGDKFYIKEGVLIPRDDTEIVVERAIKFIKKLNAKRVVDCCTGSGVIAIEVAKHTKAKVLATDISEEALEVARKNIMLSGINNKTKNSNTLTKNSKTPSPKPNTPSPKKNPLIKENLTSKLQNSLTKNSTLLIVDEKVRVIKGDLLRAFDENEVREFGFEVKNGLIKADILVSNPPYVENSWAKPNEYEPDIAFFGGEDGLDIVRELIQKAKEAGYKGAVIEIGYNQKEALSEFLKDKVKEFEFFRDLGGRVRGVEVLF